MAIEVPEWFKGFKCLWDSRLSLEEQFTDTSEVLHRLKIAANDHKIGIYPIDHGSKKEAYLIEWVMKEIGMARGKDFDRCGTRYRALPQECSEGLGSPDEDPLEIRRIDEAKIRPKDLKVENAPIALVIDDWLIGGSSMRGGVCYILKHAGILGVEIVYSMAIKDLKVATSHPIVIPQQPEQDYGRNMYRFIQENAPNEFRILGEKDLLGPLNYRC